MELCTVTSDPSRAASSGGEGIMLLDGGGRCTYLSETAAMLLGRHPGEVQRATLPELLKHGTEKKQDVMRALRHEGRLLYHAPRDGGGTKPIEVRFHRVAGNNGHGRYVGIVRNLSLMEEREEALRNQLCRERLFKECISHHFFNPLCIAQGYLQLVLNHESNGDDEAMLEATRQALARIETVVKNVIYDGDLRE